MANVLVVDDDAGIRAAVRRALVQVGHAVWDVPGGTQALPLLGLIAFDLVITDVYTDAVDGIESLTRIHARQAVHRAATARDRRASPRVTAVTGRPASPLTGRPWRRPWRAP